MDPAQQGVLTPTDLVLRCNLRQSWPPSPYELVWQAGTYEVWQRDPITKPAG